MMRRYDSYQQNDGGSGSPVSADEGGESGCTGVTGGAGFRHQFSVIGQVEDRDSVEDPPARRAALLGGTLCILLILLVAISSFDGFGRGHHSSVDCPIQSSYSSASSNLMALRTSSCVESIRNGAVATDQPVCSQVGVDILKSGGNAADAAIASALCLGVVNPASSGIGGGAFILIHSAPRVSTSAPPPYEDARDLRSKHAERQRGMLANATSSVKVAEFIDCRETAPSNATFDMYENMTVGSTLGGLAIAIPGELRGLQLLHHRFGSLPWADLVRPAMELARDGFKVESYLARAIKRRKSILRDYPNLAKLITRSSDGTTLLEQGETMVRREYAQTLNEIMIKGPGSFYSVLAETMAKDIRDSGGAVVAQDFEGYRPVLRDPLVSSMLGHTIVGSPPPSSGGGSIIGALRFLSYFPLPYSATHDTLSRHLYVEACRHVFAIRMSLSDPKYSPKENEDAIADLIEGEYMRKLQQMTLENGILNISEYGGKWAQVKRSENANLVDAHEGDRRRLHSGKSTRNLMLFNYLNDHGTSSLSVVDSEHNAVTITTSVNLEFGSKVVSKTGVVFNNQMDDFSTPGAANFFGIKPSESNYIIPGKRPLSSMSPTFVFRKTTNEEDGNLGKLVLSLGASGGPKIITSVMQTIINVCILGLDLYESVASPRIHNQLLYHGAEASNVEEGHLPQGPLVAVSDRTRSALARRGHALIPTDFLGAVQAVAIDPETNEMIAVSDVRKQGKPAGF